jgi:hypothetical protein
MEAAGGAAGGDNELRSGGEEEARESSRSGSGLFSSARSCGRSDDELGANSFLCFLEVFDI